MKLSLEYKSKVEINVSSTYDGTRLPFTFEAQNILKIIPGFELSSSGWDGVALSTELFRQMIFHKFLS